MAAPVRPAEATIFSPPVCRASLRNCHVSACLSRGSATQLALRTRCAGGEISCSSRRSSSSSSLHTQQLAQPDPSSEDSDSPARTVSSGVLVSAKDQHSWLRPEAARRKLIQLLSVSAAAACFPRPPLAHAGLLQLPATELNNEYYLIRAGESEAESQDYTLTNTVYKTNMSSGLSKQGKRQVVRQTAAVLKDTEACASGCWLWPSITQRCYQTAEILSALLDIGRSRIVPEYSFLDPRGVGAMEGLPLAQVAQQLLEGDTVSSEWRPPHGTDGTPNESVIDVLVRLRQVMSICETQYRGTSVLIIAPDSDNLSIIQAAMLGTDLRSHNQYAFKPGEVRLLQLAESRDADFFAPRNFSCPNPPLCR